MAPLSPDSRVGLYLAFVGFIKCLLCNLEHEKGEWGTGKQVNAVTNEDAHEMVDTRATYTK